MEVPPSCVQLCVDESGEFIAQEAVEQNKNSVGQRVPLMVLLPPTTIVSVEQKATTPASCLADQCAGRKACKSQEQCVGISAFSPFMSNECMCGDWQEVLNRT